MNMGKIILVGATKGGVGKSVSSYNLAYSLASEGKTVLAVDFDSQANLSTCFGIEDPAAVPVTIGHLMMTQIDDEELPEPSEYIQSRNGVDFIPASMVLSAVDAKLRLEMGAERMLALTINALAAADSVVITVNPQLLAMKGLQEFLKTIKKIKSRINPKLEVEGILLTMCEARTNLCKVISEQLTDTFEGQIRIFNSKIPNTVKVGESVYYSEPLLEYAPQTKACQAYLDFGKELIGYESKSA